MNLDIIYNQDCLEGLKSIPDNSVDLIVTDPPYEFVHYGNDYATAGASGKMGRDYHAEYLALSQQVGKNKDTERLRIIANSQQNIKLQGGVNLTYGFDMQILEECCRVMKKINIYVWCSKSQVRKLLNFFEDKGAFTDILVWCKTNPAPLCKGSYLSDIEYCVFAREAGVPVNGDYHAKHKYWVTSCNKKDKDMYKHPTIKPLSIISTLITNSSNPGEVVLDPFMGSGTTAVACSKNNRHYIGFEINEEYYNIANNRVKLEKSQLNLF